MASLTDPYTGTISPSPTMQGVVPGSGVARGGQQGRLESLHGGTGGTKAARPSAFGSQPTGRTGAKTWETWKSWQSGATKSGTPASSTKRPTPKPKPTSPPPPGTRWAPRYGWWRANASAPYQRWVKGWYAQKVQGKQSSAKGGAQAGQQGQSSQAAGQETTGNPTLDWQYMAQRRALQRQYDDSLAGITGELTRLTTRDDQGRSEYDRQRSLLRDQIQRGAADLVNQMANAGLLRSGARETATGDMTRSAYDAEYQLRGQVGDLRVRDLNQSKLALGQQLADALAALQEEAGMRFVEQGGTYPGLQGGG